jgi:hypothetical protein
MNLAQRVSGIFANPRAAFAALAEKPVWVAALLVLLGLVIIFNLVVAPYAQKDQASMMRDSVKLKERLGEERFAEEIRKLENPSPTRTLVMNAVVNPVFQVVGLLLASLIIMVLGRFVATEGRYIQIFAALIHASFIDKLAGNAVRLILILTRKSVFQVSTGLAILAPRLEITNPLYIVLASIDFFQLWLFGALALGLAAVFKVSVKKAAFISYGFWFLKTLVNIALGIFGTQMMK